MVTYRGYWWLPETPDAWVAGVLEWDGQGRPTLTLDGHIAPPQFPVEFGGGPIEVRDVILGQTVDGDEVTCFECLYTGRTLSFGRGMGQDRFTVWKGALVGLHCHAESQAEFETYYVSLTHLASWFPWSGLTEERGPGGTYTLGYSDPKEEFQADFPGAKVHVALGWSVSGPPRRRQFSESVSFALNYSEAVPPWDVQSREAEWLRKLLSLATTRSNAMERLELAARVDEKHPRLCRWLSRRLPGAAVSTFDPGSEERLHEHEVIFTAADWPVIRRTPMLTTWAQMQDAYPLTLNVLVQDVEAPTSAVDSRLLVLARAIEALHRRRYPVSAAQITRHNNRMVQLQSLLTNALWKWARGRLRYAYEPNFEARIRTLLKDVGASVGALIPDSKFCTELAFYRNAYTHEDPDDRSRRDDRSAYMLSVRAQFLLVAWILMEMGFAEDEVRQFLERNNAYQQYSSGQIG